MYKININWVCTYSYTAQKSEYSPTRSQKWTLLFTYIRDNIPVRSFYE
jgi:hypothetical protein